MRTIAEKFKCLGGNEKAEEQRVLPFFYIAVYYKYSKLFNDMIFYWMDGKNNAPRYKLTYNVYRGLELKKRI